MDTRKGVFFSDEYQEYLKSQFSYADSDPEYGHRLFFENSGGSLRLKQAVEIKRELEEFPDCPERTRGRGKDLGVFVSEGTKEIMNIIFGTSQGALVTDLTASQAMFHAVTTILDNVKWGSNAVTTQLEHPSAHDAVEYACIRTGREFREIPANPVTGGIEVDEVLKHVDENTVLVSVMAASNISGNIMDIKEISRRVHEINPDIYVISDAVQHAPHCVIDVEDWNVDVCNFAPYKFFGVRGCGFAYVSHRVANMFHARLLFKAPDVWALGTPAPGNFAAMMAVIDYVCSIGRHFSPSTYGSRELFVEGMNRIHLQERALLHDHLVARRDVERDDLAREARAKGDHARAVRRVDVLEDRLARERLREHLADAAALGLHGHVGRHPRHRALLGDHLLAGSELADDDRERPSLDLVLHPNPPNPVAVALGLDLQ